MADTKLISPGIPNYTLNRNLRLNDKYLSNDGGNEGITITDNGSTVVSVVDSASLKLDGANDFVNLDDILDTYFTGADEKFTISAWIKPSTISGTQHIVSKFYAASDKREFAFYIEEGILKLALSDANDDDSPAIYSVAAAYVLSIDTWYQVGVTVNLDDNIYIIYKDGVNIGSYSASTSGNGMTLTLPSWSMSLDGTADYMDITSDNLGTTNTISWWYKMDTLLVHPTGLAIPIGSTTYDGGGYYVYTVIETTLANSVVVVRIGDTTVTFAAGTDLTDPAGDWTHFAVVRNGDDFKLYIDGEPIDGTKTMSGHSGADTVINRIGAGDRGEVPPETYDVEGKMDEIAFFNDAKTTADIEEIYNDGVPVDLTGRAVYNTALSGYPYAAGFNGSSSKITVSSSGTDIDDLFNTLNKLTIAFWVKTDNSAGSRHAVFGITNASDTHAETGNRQSFNFQLYNNGDIYWTIDGKNNQYVFDTGAHTHNVWTHYILIYDGALAQGDYGLTRAKVYQNGVALEMTVRQSGGIIPATIPDMGAQDFTLGTMLDAGGTNRWLKGNLSEVAIWANTTGGGAAIDTAGAVAFYGGGTTLDPESDSGSYDYAANLDAYWKLNEGTGTNIVDHHEAAYTGTLANGTWAGLQHYWRFEEGTGTDIADSSVNSNDGTLVNATFADDSANVIAGAHITDLTDTDAHLAIGSAHGEAAADTFAGTMDDVAIWNTDLDSEEMTLVGNTDHRDLADPVSYNDYTDGSSVTHSTLVGYWRLNEGTGGTGATTADESGQGNDGIIAGSPTWPDGQASAKMTIGTDLIQFHVPIDVQSSGAENKSAQFSTDSQNTLLRASKKAVKFNGSDEFIGCGDIADTDAVHDLSVAFWVNFSSIAGEQQLVTKGAYNVSGDCWAIKWIAGTLYFSVSNSITAVDTDLKLIIDTWYHIVVTYSNTSDAIVFYLNSTPHTVSEASFTIDTSGGGYIFIPENTGRDVRIGFGYEASDYFNGKMQEVGIWDAALSSTEVTAIYNNGRTLDLSIAYGGYAKQGDLQAYWKMDEAKSNSFTDSSTHSNTGTGTGIDITNWVDGNTISTLDSDYDSVKVYKELDIRNAALKLSYDDDSYSTLDVGANSALTITPSITSTVAGTYIGTGIDFDKSGASTSDNTLIALNIDADNTTATNGSNSLYGIKCTPTLTHAADAGTALIYGTYIETIGSTNGALGLNTNTGLWVKADNSDYVTGLEVTATNGGTSNIGIKIVSTDGGTDLRNSSSANGNDYFSISTIADGETTLTTVESGGGSTAHLNMVADGDFTVNAAQDVGITATRDNNFDIGRDFSVDAEGSIVLDSDGSFIAKRLATEFSVANSAYAGMILGYTTVGIDAAKDSYNLTSTMTCLDDAMKVKFVAPPSGVVEIFAQIYFDAYRRLPVLGLSDQDESTGYQAISFPNATDVTNEHLLTIPPSSGGDQMLRPHWVVAGLTPGTAYEWWFAAKVTSSVGGVLRWGGNATDEYPPFIMKATALPTAVSDYAVYG